MKLLFISFCISAFASAQTARINFQAPDAYPEGVAYDGRQDVFFVSSVRTGTIGKVTPAGKYTEFYRDSTLRSSYGMKVDSLRNKLWFCAGDPNYSKYSSPATFKKMIRLVSVDLATGQKKDDIDLSNIYPGEHFANDLTLDDKGNIYITDSYSPVVYKVDGNGNASVFSNSEWFRSADIGLNGIAWSDKGYLVVAQNGSGTLYKIDMKDPQRVTRIKMKTFFPGADGLSWNKTGELSLVQNKSVNKVFLLSSTDNWQSAEVKAATKAADRFQQPSTSVMRKGDLYIMNSRLNELADKMSVPAREFNLQLAVFKPL